MHTELDIQSYLKFLEFQKFKKIEETVKRSTSHSNNKDKENLNPIPGLRDKNA